jgi:glycosyltransferase involved in cell wall biosynthesis
MLLSNDGVADPRVEKEALALAAAGWEVTVLAWDRSGQAPVREVRADRVVYERLGPRAPYGGGPRSLPRFREFWHAAAERTVAIGPSVVHCHDLDTAPAGLRALGSVSPRPALVLDMHELYRESNMVPQRGVVGLAARSAVRLLERRAYSAADAILVANPGTVGYYERLGAGEKVVVVENAPDADLFGPVDRPAGGRFVIGYFGQKRYIEELRLLIEVVAGHEGLGAVLAGGGTAEAEVERLAQGVDRIEVSGRFRYSELPALYGRCDAVYAVYDARLGNVRTLFPVKVMEAMACALPVIVAEGTWIGEYVNANRIGVAVPAGDREALERAITTLSERRDEARAMGCRGRALVEAGLNWRAASARLVETYERLRAARPGTSR